MMLRGRKGLGHLDQFVVVVTRPNGYGLNNWHVKFENKLTIPEFHGTRSASLEHDGEQAGRTLYSDYSKKLGNKKGSDI
jgi:hypothetical protein